MHDRGKELLKGIRDSAVVKNPVLFEAIGLAPVAAMAVSLKSAIILAVVSCAELVIIELLACLVLKRIKSYFRVAAYAVLGVLINIPIFMFFEYFTPNEAQNAGIFLPLLAVNSLVALHCERFAVKNPFGKTFVDAVSASAGYALVVLLVGTVREILGSGTIYSVDLKLPVQLPGFLYPFGGLLLLGFLAAGVKALILRRHPDAHPEQAFDMREISQSHVGKLRNLLDADFNPYDEEETAAPAPRARAEKRRKTHDAPAVEPPVQAPEAETAETTERRTKKAEKKMKKRAKPEKTPRGKSAKAASKQADAPKQNASEQPPQRTRRTETADYLSEFDEILSELDAYREKYGMPDDADKADGAQTPASGGADDAEDPKGGEEP